MQKKCNALKEINAGRLIEVLGSEKDNVIVVSDDEFAEDDGDSSSGLSMSDYHDKDDVFSLQSQSRVSVNTKNDPKRSAKQSAAGKREKSRIDLLQSKSGGFATNFH